MSKPGFVYIMARARNGTLYIGVTNDIARRAGEHRLGLVPGFTKTYDIKLLVHVEAFGDIADAITREKQLKGWRREWKVRLIQAENEAWRDLYAEMFPGWEV